MTELKEIKSECKCEGCNKRITVAFYIRPTEEEKRGFYCEDCTKKMLELEQE